VAVALLPEARGRVESLRGDRIEKTSCHWDDGRVKILSRNRVERLRPQRLEKVVCCPVNEFRCRRDAS
jgi:hypothetical protein